MIETLRVWNDIDILLDQSLSKGFFEGIKRNSKFNTSSVEHIVVKWNQFDRSIRTIVRQLYKSTIHLDKGMIKIEQNVMKSNILKCDFIILFFSKNQTITEFYDALITKHKQINVSK